MQDCGKLFYYILEKFIHKLFLLIINFYYNLFISYNDANFYYKYL